MAGGRPGAAPDVAVVRALDGAVALSAGDGGTPAWLGAVRARSAG